MTPTLLSPTLLASLRATTRPYHEAVEQNPFNRALAAGTVTAAATAHFLSRMYGFLQPYEAQLRAQAPSLGPAWELPRRYRAHLILEDLPRLGELTAPPVCRQLPPLGTRAQLLGAMYVLEGSTLGGQVIARQLAKAGIAAHAYFTGRGDHTGPLWKVFCQQLEAAGAAEDSAEIVQSAITVFQALSLWLSRS